MEHEDDDGNAAESTQRRKDAGLAAARVRQGSPTLAGEALERNLRAWQVVVNFNDMTAARQIGILPFTSSPN